MHDEWKAGRIWSLKDPEVQRVKERFIENQRRRPRCLGYGNLDFDDLFLYFSNPKHLGVRHKARQLGRNHDGLATFYREYLYEFFGPLNRNAGPPRRRKK